MRILLVWFFLVWVLGFFYLFILAFFFLFIGKQDFSVEIRYFSQVLAAFIGLDRGIKFWNSFLESKHFLAT